MEAKKTPLFDLHKGAGAYMADFAGWNMPIYYTSVIEEHKCVRTSAGLFDLCHMGLVRIAGAGAYGLIDKLIANNLKKVSPFGALYSPMCYENGTTVDDIIVYCLNPEDFILIVNASNMKKDLDWIKGHNDTGASVEDMTEVYGLVGIQGPQAFEAAYSVLGQDFSTLDYFSFCSAVFDSKDIFAARTGYTGEKGLELVVPKDSLSALWESFTKCEDVSVGQVGLGARDSLRLEMGYSLYGHELTDTITPLEAGIGWAVDLNKDYFIGKDALCAEAPKRKIGGFILDSRMIARHGTPVFDGDKKIGVVTSGGFSPILEKSIGLALVDVDSFAVDKSVRFNTRKDKFITGSFCKKSFLQSRTK